MSTLLLSDLHLPPRASPLREAFLRFLTGPAREAQAVYILGDLFELWIGDDAGLRTYAEEAGALKRLTPRVPVFFMHGNRDFLLGERFASATGMQLLRDPQVVKLHGTPTLLSHGDLWCTDDRAYQRWRRFSRLPPLQAGYRALPHALRAAIAGGVRSTSLVQKRSKAEDIMDVNAAAIAAAFVEHDVTRIIHGHTHRPAEHRNSRRVRIVLADWKPGRCEYLQVDAGSLKRVNI